MNVLQTIPNEKPDKTESYIVEVLCVSTMMMNGHDMPRMQRHENDDDFPSFQHTFLLSM
jgi:hypothetical protein